MLVTVLIVALILMLFAAIVWIVILIRKEKVRAAEFEAEKAEEEREEVRRFLSNMSHDVRTPLNAIIGFSELAEQVEGNPEKTNSYLSRIEDSANFLLHLLKDVLDNGRFDNGQVQLEENDCNLADVAEMARKEFSKAADEKGLTLHVNLKSLENPKVYSDEKKLLQIFHNLLDNAVKHTPSGGEVLLSIREKMTQDDKPGKPGEIGMYELRVKDNGVGMDRDLANRIFEAFEREEVKKGDEETSVGMGLTLTQKLVKVMGGTIFVRTAPGEGAEFVVTLPLERQAIQTTVSRNEASAMGSSDEGTSSNDVNGGEKKLDFTGKRVLLVDDIETNRMLANEILRQHGFTIEEAVNGEEAVRKVEENDAGYYDVVLMDVRMPVMNGYEATKAIRGLAQDITNRLPVIAMTADAFEEDIQAAHKAGMDRHVSKPIRVPELMGAIAELLDESAEES